MFDAAAAAYEAYVVAFDDIADAAPAEDEEEVVQVLLLGSWHRTVPLHNETSCGVPFNAQFHVRRLECLSERERHDRPAAPMCPECFTKHELARAAAADRVAAAEAERRAEAERKEWDEMFEELRVQRRHLTTLRGMPALPAITKPDEGEE